MEPARIIVHGNAKSSDDLRGAVAAGAGRIVIDCLAEIDRLARIARRAQSVLIHAMADIRDEHDVLLKELNIGGGHGVPYVDTDAELDLAELATAVDEAVDSTCAPTAAPLRPHR